MSDDPWCHIQPPSESDAINSLRVDANLPWDFFWARGHDNRIMLTLRHDSGAVSQVRLPTLRHIDVVDWPGGSDGRRTLVIRLLEASHRDIFLTLCRDIAEAAAKASSEAEVVALAVRRTWRWHQLLRAGADQRLTPEEQRGLAGELLVLSRYLLSRLPSAACVASWTGPTDAPKDFEIGRIAIESKARRGGATPYIAISSEHQLDTTGVDHLFLHVVPIDRSPDSTDASFTLPELAASLRGRIEASDPGAAERFDTLLFAAGLLPEHNYDDFRWVAGESRLFDVEANFPRFGANDVPQGVSLVRYSIALAACEPFATTGSVLHSTISGEGGSDADYP